jgi:hypothetical protein
LQAYCEDFEGEDLSLRAAGEPTRTGKQAPRAQVTTARFAAAAAAAEIEIEIEIEIEMCGKLAGGLRLVAAAAAAHRRLGSRREVHAERIMYAAR